jgi:ubiquinone/menaquinone biosynthesis C-methylase UbiE
MISAERWTTRSDEWAKRVKMFGTRAVFNICHPPAELEAVTKLQRDTILPLFKSQVTPADTYVLDFGCGWGRWTETLSEMVDGIALGVDPTPEFLAEAEKRRTSACVQFLPYAQGRVPMEDSGADVVWACLVLSTVLEEDMLAHTVGELGRVLRPGGLMFLVDNTAGPAHRPVVRSRWSMSRTVEEYRAAFAKWVDLQLLGAYTDLGEVNSIMAGRKRV